MKVRCADAEVLIDMILNLFVVAERPVVLADTYLLHWRVPHPDAGSGSSRGVRPMMAKMSAFGVIVATDFIRSSNADPLSGSCIAAIVASKN